jgi:hypothetical protein
LFYASAALPGLRGKMAGRRDRRRLRGAEKERKAVNAVRNIILTPTMNRPLAIVAALFVSACQPTVPNPASVNNAEAQKKEEDFRWKERCAIAAERLEKDFARPAGSTSEPTSLSEVFYSPTRNSCVCEVNAVSSLGNRLTLYDCLTREELASTFIQFTSDSDRRTALWKQTKAKLK